MTTWFHERRLNWTNGRGGVCELVYKPRRDALKRGLLATAFTPGRPHTIRSLCTEGAISGDPPFESLTSGAQSKARGASSGVSNEKGTGQNHDPSFGESVALINSDS